MATIENLDLVEEEEPMESLFLSHRQTVRQHQQLADARRRTGVSINPETPEESESFAKEVAESFQGREAGMIALGDAIRTIGTGMATFLRRAPKDIGKGIVMESAPAVKGGLRDSLESLLGLEQSLLNSAARAIASEEELPEVERRIREQPEQLLSEVPRPETMTGNVIREGTRFLSAFIPAFKALRGTQLLGGGTLAAETTAAALATGISDALVLEPTESALDGLIEADPSLRGPIEKVLAGGEDEGELEGRLRNALVGAGLGAMTDTMVIGIRGLRNARRLRQKAQEATSATVSEKAISTQDAMGLPGNSRGRWLVRFDENRPVRALEEIEQEISERFGDRPIGREQIRALAEAELESGARRLEINFARMRGPEDLNQLTQEVTDLFAGRVDEARRGVRSNEQTLRAAEYLQLDVDELLRRRQGVAFNAEEVEATIGIWEAARSQLYEMAEIASGSSRPQDHVRLRHMMTLFQAINEQFFGVRAEAGRALQIFQSRAGTVRTKQLNRILDNFGGIETSHDLAEAILKARAHDMTPGQLRKFMEKGWSAKIADAAREHYVAGLLWSPPTHIANSVSHYLMALQRSAELGAGARIGQARRFLGGEATSEDVSVGEATAALYGITQGVRTLFGTGLHGVRNETGIRRAKGVIDALQAKRRELGISQGSKRDQVGAAISSDAIGVDPTSALGRAVDVYGGIERFPFSGLDFEDDLGKIVTFTMALHHRAFRNAVNEGLTGRAAWKRMHEIVSNPTDDLLHAADETALELAFQTPLTGNLKRVADLGRTTPAWFWFPFQRTPINILRYSMERNPVGAVFVREFREDVAAGGGRRDLALAKLSVGVLIGSYFMDMAAQGRITGEFSGERRGISQARSRSGMPPNSVRFGDQTFALNRLDNLGFSASVAGTYVDRLRRLDMQDEDLPLVYEALAAYAVALGESSMNRSFLQGLQEAERAFRSEQSMSIYLARGARSFIPLSSLVNIVGQAVTPEQVPDRPRSRADQLLDEAQQVLFGLERQIPILIDHWGREIGDDAEMEQIGNLLLPARVREVKLEPIDRVILENGINVTDIERRTSFGAFRSNEARSTRMARAGSVDINFRAYPRVFEEYKRLAGNDLKIDPFRLGKKRGQLDLLNAIVEGKVTDSQVSRILRPSRARPVTRWSELSLGPDGGKADLIRRVGRIYRREAQRHLMTADGLEIDGIEAFRAHVLEKAAIQSLRDQPQSRIDAMRVIRPDLDLPRQVEEIP